MYAADTHSFLWYLTQDNRLGVRARKAFEECDNAREVIVIPSIVLIESLFLCEKYKVNLKFEEVLLKLSLSPNYTIHPLNEEVILECAKLKLPDPHDRIIAATALLLGVPLITRDEKIRETKGIDTIWD